MHFEVSYQSEVAQDRFNENNPNIVFCFSNKAFKQAEILAEAKKFGHGVLHVVNGKDVLEMICF